MKMKTFKAIAISRLRMGTDGEGVRTLVAAWGCPLRCRYCLNPHSWKDETPVEEYTAPELYEELKVDNLYYLATGGGITFGGGEPLLYAGFIKEFADYTERKWDIALETSLNVPRSALEEVIGSVDKFFVDIKSMDEGIYSAYTCGDNGQMMENLAYLLSEVSADKVVVRVPYIPGYTEDVDVERSIEQLKDMGVTNIDCLTYYVRN